MMRRRQILQLRAAGVLPPIDSHLRAAWELARAQRLSAEIAAQDASWVPPAVAETVAADPVEPIWPKNSDKTCPHCGRVILRGWLDWHVKACPERPRPAT